jgi:hypothetical protein
MADWTFVYTDRMGVPQGEILNASDRKVTKPLNSLDTASFKVRLDNPWADALSTCQGSVKGYRGDSLEFYGDIVSAEENIDDTNGTLAVNLSCGWNLTKRLVGKSKTGLLFGTLTRGQIVSILVNTVNLDDPTGVETTTEQEDRTDGGLMTSYVAGPYKPFHDVLRELSVGTEGFDWRVVPVDGEFFTKAHFETRTVMGQQRPDSVFEFGVGRNNVQSYKRTVNREGQANTVYHNASAGPDAPGYPTVFGSNFDASEVWGLLEDVAQGDLQNEAARQALVDAHAEMRGFPRQIIEFVPHLDDGTGRVPQYGTDFFLGDQIRGRFAYNGMVRMDAYLRLYGVSFEIDAEGTERVTFTLSDQGAS